MKVFIATPCTDQLNLQFVRSLLALDKPESMISFWENSLVYAARDTLCGQFLESDCDYLLFVDSDMTFQPDALNKLIADDKDIVGGLCFRRRPPYTPAMWKKIRFGADGEHEEEDYTDYPRDSLFEVDASGVAFALIKREVVQQIAEHFKTCFQPYKCYGEDISFCIRAKQLGFSVWTDSRVKIGHMAQTCVSEEVFDSLRAVRR